MNETTESPFPVVLQVLPALDGGGVERGTVEVAQAITRAGGTALVASAGGRLVPSVLRAGGRHVTLKLDSKNPWRIWRNATALAQLIREARVDIVHARSRAPAWSAWLAAQRTGVHFVTTYHAPYAEQFMLKRRYNAIMAQGEIVIAISHFVAALIQRRHGVPASRIRVIPRGVDPAMFDPARVATDRMARLAKAWRVEDGHPTIMLPGRLTRWKGQTVLIEALWGKRRIMEMYLNSIEWGPGVYGAEAASQAYFHVSADRLSPDQAARLAAILPSPLKWKAVRPGRYVARRSARIGQRAATVREDDLAACVLDP